MRFAPRAGARRTLTFTRLPPRSFLRNALRAFLDSLSVTALLLPATRFLVVERKRTFLALAPIRTLPEALALRRNDRLPFADTFTLESLNLRRFGATTV